MKKFIIGMCIAVASLGASAQPATATTAVTVHDFSAAVNADKERRGLAVMYSLGVLETIYRIQAEECVGRNFSTADVAEHALAVNAELLRGTVEGKLKELRTAGTASFIQFAFLLSKRVPICPVY